VEVEGENSSQVLGVALALPKLADFNGVVMSLQNNKNYNSSYSENHYQTSFSLVPERLYYIWICQLGTI